LTNYLTQILKPTYNPFNPPDLPTNKLWTKFSQCRHQKNPWNFYPVLEVSKALAPPQVLPKSLFSAAPSYIGSGNGTLSEDIAAELDESAIVSGNPFSFASFKTSQLIMEHIMSVSISTIFHCSKEFGNLIVFVCLFLFSSETHILFLEFFGGFYFLFFEFMGKATASWKKLSLGTLMVTQLLLYDFLKSLTSVLNLFLLLRETVFTLSGFCFDYFNNLTSTNNHSLHFLCYKKKF